MKPVILIICLFFATTLMAQQGEPADSTKTEEDGYGIGTPPDRENEEENVVEFKIGNTDTTKTVISRWGTFGLGVNIPLDGENITDQTMQDDWDLRTFKSTNVDIGIVQWKINLADHKLYLNSGVGFDISKFMFEDNFWIDPDSDDWETDYAILDDIDTKKNRLTLNYLHVPLMLNFESSTKHYESFRLSAGAFGGLRIGSNQKIKFKDKDDNPFDDKKKYKEKDDFNINNFTYGLRGEFGYGPVTLYGKYHLQEIFEEDSTSPRLNNLSVGIMLLPF